MLDDETSVVADQVTRAAPDGPSTWVCGSCGAFGEVDDDQRAAFAALDEHVGSWHTIWGD
jgi:hypothetical protein